MTLQLPRLSPIQPPWQDFQVWWQQVCEAIEANEAAQTSLFDELEAQLDASQAAIVMLAIGFSYTIPTLVLTATDAGADVTITIADHDRRYGDGEVLEITGDTLTGLSYSTNYAVYYDDVARTDPSPVFHATTNLQTAQANYIDGRHYVGTVATPAAAGAPTTGGAPPAGSGYTAGAGSISIL